MEDTGALPNDTGFWDYLMSSTLEDFKMLVYEQDWLDVQVRNTKELQVSTVGLSTHAAAGSSRHYYNRRCVLRDLVH